MNRRTSEFGIRMAIGAQRQSVLWLILRESLTICVVGLVIGLPVVFLSTRLLESLLFGLAPHDPLVLCLATATIVLICIAASLIPARRATSVDPAIALR